MKVIKPQDPNTLDCCESASNTDGEHAGTGPRESDDRYRWMAELSPDGIVVHTDDAIKFANQSFAQIMGAESPDELIGKSMLEFIDPEQHKDALERRKLVESGEVVALAEAKFLRLDGSVTHVERVVSPIMWENEASFLTIVRDINERVRAETALRKSEERYELAVKASNAGLWDWNIETDEGYFSPRWKEILGYGEDELEPRVDTFFEFLHPDDSERTRRANAAHLKDRTPYNLEYRLRHKNGGYVWVQAAGQAVWNDHGEPVRMAGSITDISDRKQAEQALTDSEIRYRQLAEMSPDGMFVQADGEIVFANNRLAQILAYPSPQDFIGKRAIELPAPEYRDDTKDIRAKAMGGEVANLTQAEFLRADGSRVPVERSGARIIWEGTPAVLVLIRDVSERAKAEEALRQSEERLRAITDHSPSAIFLKDTKGRYFFANRVWHEMYNPTGADITGKTVHDMLPPEVADRMAADDAKVLETGEPEIEEQYVPTAGGGWQYILSTKFPVRDSDGNVIALGVVNTNVSDRVATEHALRESEERFRSVIDNSPAALSMKDLDGRFQLVNPKFTEWFGRNPKDVIGKTAYDISPTNASDVSVALDQQVTETGRTHEQEIEYPFPDGTLHSLVLTKFPVLDADNKIIGTGTITSDNTERNRAQKALVENRDQLRLITDNLPVLITYIDAEKRYRFLNKIGSEWHAKPIEEIIGKSIPEVLGQEYEKIRPQVDKALAGKQLTYVENIDYRDGVTRTVRITYVPHVTTAGNVGGFFILAEDISELKQAEQALQQAQKMEAIGQLTGGIAHDFNNILMVVDGYTRRALTAAGKPAAVEEALDEVLKGTDRAAQLTKQLLTFSRRQIMERRVFRVEEALLDIEALLRRSTGERYELHFDNDCGGTCIETDASEFNQALVNLVINARDAMADGGSIEIASRVVELDEAFTKAHQHLTPGRFVEVSVCDHGTGIDNDTLEHIFEPFFTTKDQGKGTGLGLSMVYGFTQNSQGTIEVESAIGEGTTFKIYLPAVDRDPQALIADVETDCRGNGETILLVEDDDALLELVRGMLEALGYIVLIAHDGPEALEVEEDFDSEIDLILSDVVMPVIGGFEVAAMIRESRPDVKVVFMSGYPNRAGISNENVPENCQFLQKPVKANHLAQTLRHELDGASASVAEPKAAGTHQGNA